MRSIASRTQLRINMIMIIILIIKIDRVFLFNDFDQSTIE